MEALEARQDAILARLGQLKDQVAAYKKTLGLPEISTPSVNVTKTADIVIRCSPTFPTFSLKGIYTILTAMCVTRGVNRQSICSKN